MKKKLMIALFAAMSAASMQAAYYIEIDNKTSGSIWAGTEGRMTMVRGQQKRRINPSFVTPLIRVVQGFRSSRSKTFPIPQPMRGKNIIVTVNSTKSGLKASFKLKELV